MTSLHWCNAGWHSHMKRGCDGLWLGPAWESTEGIHQALLVGVCFFQHVAARFSFIYLIVREQNNLWTNLNRYQWERCIETFNMNWILHCWASKLTVVSCGAYNCTLGHHINSKTQAILWCKLKHTWFPALSLMAASTVYSLHSKV